MKRYWMVLLAAILLIGCAAPAAAPKTPAVQQTAAAAEATAAEETPEPASLAETAAAAWREAGYLADMARYSDADLLDLYGIDTAECRSAAGYADAVGYTNEVVIVETDETTAAEIESLLREHLTAMENQFRSYDPEAQKLVEAAVLIRDGGMVLMIVSPDAEAMRDLLQ